MGGGGPARRNVFRRAVVDDSKGRVVAAASALVSRQSDAADEYCGHRLLRGFWRTWGAPTSVSPRIRHGELLRDSADATVGRSPRPRETGGRPCALLRMSGSSGSTAF